MVSAKDENQCACSSEEVMKDSSNFERENRLQAFHNDRESWKNQQSKRRKGEPDSKKRKRNLEEDNFESTSKRRSSSGQCSTNSVSVIPESVDTDDDAAELDENERHKNESEMLDTREKELARWIKRCQMECEKQKKR